MLLKEFIDRCGYKPTVEEWEQITLAYMAHSGDKDEFCAEWCKLNPDNAGALKRAEKRDKELQKQVAKFVKWYNAVADGKTCFVTGWRNVSEAAGLFMQHDVWEHVMRKAWSMCDRGELRGFYLAHVAGICKGSRTAPNSGYWYYRGWELLSRIKE